MRTQNTADRLDEIMILADTHAYARVKDGTPRAHLPYTHLKNAVQAVLAENEALRTGYDAARLEIASLRERVQMLGQLARDVNSRRVLELEAQLEAVQEGRDIQGDIDRYNENTMTDTKQPEALRLADAMERFTKSSHWWTDGEPIHIAVAAELRSLHTENDTLRAGYDAARQEIESLQAQAQQCGAGAGCCAQATRIEELEAQLEALEAVGSGGAGRLAPDVSLINEGDMPAAQALDRVCIFWQQHTQADALSMTMAELHDDAERTIRAARGAAQAAPSNGALAAPAQAEAPAGVEAVGEMRASESLGVAPYADIWGWLQPGTKLYSATQVQAMLAAAPQQAAQDALAYQAACSLATRLFKKHFSKNVEYASGKVTWGLCDTTVGVISQIVNMVFWLAEPAAQAQPVATIYVTEDGSREVDDWKVELPVGATTLYTAAQAQPDDQQARGTDAG